MYANDDAAGVLRTRAELCLPRVRCMTESEADSNRFQMCMSKKYD
jgi:hypothetical protein